MSCCGGNCGCGSGCKCGNGCGGCKMYPEVEATATKTTVLVAATHKASSGGLEMAAENGGCDCTTCKCGNGCGGCKMYPEVEATATKTTVLVAATHKASSGGLEMAAENGGCDCTTCKCGCSCCNCN